MINAKRFGSCWLSVFLLGFILIFHPFQDTMSQEKGKFKLGPQLMPVRVNINNIIDNPSPPALISNCNNSDFSLGDWTNWDGCYGYFNNSCQIQGFKTNPPHPLHKIISAPGYLDFNTCNNLLNVFPGESFVARLGDTVYSSATTKAAELKYQVNVTSDSYLFIYRYAVVLQSGNHDPSIQPDFKVMITDDDGTVLDSTCGYYYIAAQQSGPPVPGWNQCSTIPNGSVYWKDWTTVGMDLTSYLGQTIFIVFKVRPCTYNTHFGYAYISSYCNQLEIQTALCEGQDSAILTAPPGFSYYWMAITGDPSINGDTTASITVPSIEGSSYTCSLTAANGCEVEIINILHYTQIHAGFTETLSCAHRPSSFQDTSWVSQNEVTAWRWFFGDPASGASDSSHLENPTHSFTSTGTFNVTLISYSTEGCSDTTIKQFTIDPLPDITNASHYKAICSHGHTDIMLSSSVSGTLFSWTVTATAPTITGFSNQATPVIYLNQQLVNSGNEIDSVIYKVLPHKNTCTGDDTNFFVAVYPHPNLTNAVRVKSICDSVFTSVILESNLDTTRFTWTCTASSLNVTGFSDNIATPDTLINQLLRNTGFTIDTVYYHIVPHAYGCPGDTTIYKVAVYPRPDLSNTPKRKVICNNTPTNITLTSNVANTGFTWTCTASSPNITGYNNNPSIPTTTLNQTLLNSGTGIDSVIYHITPHSSGCNGYIFNYAVVVNPVPLVANPPPLLSSICSGDTVVIPISSTTTGTTFSWTTSATSGNLSGFSPGSGDTIRQALSNTGATIEDVIYFITPDFNGCTGLTASYTVNVKPRPAVIASPLSESICSDQVTGITLSSAVSGTTFAWTAAASSPSVTGYSNGNGNQISQLLMTPGFTVETVTYTITGTSSGCSGPMSQVVVTINPKPHLTTNPMSDTICSENETNILLTASCPGTTYNWTASLVSGNVTGFSNGSDSVINQVLTNNIFIFGKVQYTIVPTAGACQGSDTNFYVVVKPKPDLSNTPKRKTICNNSSTNLTLSSNVSNTSFTWSATASSANISGYQNNLTNPTTILNQTLVNSGYNIDSVVYHITPHSNGCDGTVTDYTVVVYPTPDLSNNPKRKQICDSALTNINLISNVSGTMFTWTATASSPNITGFSQNPSGPVIIINEPLYNAGNTIDSVTYHITPHANGCNGNLTNFVVVVNPYPQVTTSASQIICSGTSSVAAPLSTNVTTPGTVFSWFATASDPGIFGYLSNGTGTPIPAQIIWNPLLVQANVVYNISASFLGCPGGETDHTIYINPSPTVTPSPLLQNICNGQSTALVNFSSNVSATTYTWMVDSTFGVTGYLAGGVTDFIPGQAITLTGTAAGFVKYKIIPSSQIGLTCPGAPSYARIVVNPLPSPLISGSNSVCAQQSNVAYSTPAIFGHSYNWTITGGTITSGSATNSITVAWGNAGTGSLNLTETIQATGCLNTSSYNITINPLPTPVISGLNTVCEFSTQMYSSPGLPGHNYNWSVIGGSIQSGQGTNQITVLWGPAGNASLNLTETILATGCLAPSPVFSVTLEPYPVAAGSITGPNSVCESSSGIIYSVPLILYATSYNWTYSGTGVTIINSGNAVTLNFALNATSGNLVVKGMNNCGTGPSTAFFINVHPLPDVTFTSCYDPITTTASQPFKLKGGIPYGGIYSGTGVNTGYFYPGLAGPGNHVITYSYTNTWGCIKNAMNSITVFSVPGYVCGNPLADIRDNQQYPTVQIGTQCWMAANLNYGNAIPSSSMQRDNCYIEKYCLNDNPANCSADGAFYQWDELMNHTTISGAQGLCPPGWHVPTENDWNTLFNLFNGKGFAGSPLKSDGYTGFNAFLFGVRFENALWDFSNFATMFWTSTHQGPLKAWAHGLNTYTPSVSSYPASRSNAFSVRCVKD